VPVVINEIVTEVVVAPHPAEAGRSAEPVLSEEVIEVIVRRAVERMRETLRREWDR
jgi:hypothetical protein